MAGKWSSKEQEVRDKLLEHGTECPLDDCDVIIQPDREGSVRGGVQMHMRVVHNAQESKRKR